MNARTRKSLTLLWTALFLFSLALQSVQLATPAPALAAHLENLFELDGNAADDPANEPDDDWNSVDHSLDHFFAGASSEAAAVDTTYFTTGGSKDENNISSWKRTATGGSPDKNELLDAYAAVYKKADTGDTWVYFGADRFDNDGDAQIGFWFFQNTIGLNGADFTGVHKVGDVLILSEYTNGGAVDAICAYEWSPPGGNNSVSPGNCDPATNGSNLNLVAAGSKCDVAEGTFGICAVTNSTTTNAPWTFVNKDGQTNFGPGQFYEGGINLTDMFGGQAPCFGTFLAETRSSQETDAQLKDFALGSLDTCVPPKIETQVKQGTTDVSKINKGESVVDVATFSGSNGTVAGKVDFFVCGPGANGSKPDCTSGGDPVGGTVTIANESATSAAFTPTALGWYCFRAEYTPATGSEYLKGNHTNDTTECFKVIPADVQIVKTPNNGTASAGDNISFTLSWTNEGEGSAAGVVVTDTVPAPAGVDWSISGSTGTGSTCTLSAAEVLTCNVGTIAGNPNFPNAAPVNGTVTLTSATTKASCGEINNTGQVTSTNDGTDTDPGKITVQCPNVNVVKTPNDGQVNAGDAASFSIVVSNAGPGTATNVTLSDPLPVGLTWIFGSVTGDIAGLTCSVSPGPGPQTLSCTHTSMTAGQSFTVTVTTTTTSAQCAAYPNLATVDAANEPDTAAYTDDNTDPGKITVNCPDVQALKTADKSPVNAGDPIGFTVTIKNNGTGTAYGATGSDTLPAGITWSIDGAANGWQLVGNALTFGPADLAPGASAAVHIVGTTDAADCGVVPNTVTVDATNESNAADITDDNSATASVTVNCPDLRVVKTAVDDTISAGEVAAFSIVITNIGAGTAYDVSLSDILPGGVAWNLDSVTIDGVVAPDPGALCTISGISLSCPDLGNLAAGKAISIAISGDTDLGDCGPIVNSVTVDASNESNLPAFTGNNTDSATIVIDCPALAIDKDADHVNPVLIGNQIGFTISIKNNGAGTAFGVTVADTLDSDFTWSIAAPSTGWSLVGNALSFSGNLAAGATSTVHVVAPTTAGNASQCGVVPNTAVLDHASIDPTPASASETVQCPQIDIAKGASDDLVEPNQTVSFQLNVQVVDGPVTDAVVTDSLPVGQTYVAGSAKSKVNPAAVFSADEPTVSADGRTLTWEFALLGTGDPSVTITYDVKIDANATTARQVNTAQVCVSELHGCVSADEDVTPQRPDIQLIKTAGTAPDGQVFNTEAGPVTYTYVVTNTGPLPLSNVTVTDDAGTPAVAGDDFQATCPKTTLAVGESMTCTFTIDVQVDTHNIAVARGVTAEGNPVEDSDDAAVVILHFGLVLDKTNNAPLKPLELPDGTIVNLPTADEGATVTYTLSYDLQGDPVTAGVLTDVLPLGVTYVAGSATNSAQFIFQGYDTATRTLRWTAQQVSEDGSVTYQATIDEGAAEFVQPLHNVATIDSAQTLPDVADSDVYVPTVVAGATATPRITLPPTDSIATDTPTPSSPGFALMLILLFLAAVTLVVGFVTPVPVSVRERRR